MPSCWLRVYIAGPGAHEPPLGVSTSNAWPNWPNVAAQERRKRDLWHLGRGAAGVSESQRWHLHRRHILLARLSRGAYLSAYLRASFAAWSFMTCESSASAAIKLQHQARCGHPSECMTHAQTVRPQ